MRLVLLRVTVICGVLACESKPSPEVKDASVSNEAAASSPAPTAQLTDDAACRNAAGAERPQVRWATNTGYTADLNYDRAPDIVVWGTEGDSVFVVSIVECAQGTPGRVWSVPLRRAAWGTLDIDVSLTNPAFGRGYLEENCMGAETTAVCRHLAALDARLEAAYQEGGRGLQIGIPDRHNLHLYWDADSSRFVLWGL